MPLNVEEFKSQGLVGGGARPSLFEVIFPQWPGGDDGTVRRLVFLAKASSIPPSVEGSVEVPFQGRRIKVIGDRQYANWSITIINDIDFSIRTAFEQWHQNMNMHIENVMLDVSPQPATYKRNAIVRQLSKDGAVLKTYSMMGLFPVTIEQIGLDWEATDQIELFEVEFSVDYFLPYDYDGLAESQAFSELASPPVNLFG